MLDAGFDRFLPCEDRLHFLGLCRGGYINIEGLFSHQKIPHATANGIRTMPMQAKHFDNMQNILTKLDLHDGSPFFFRYFSIAFFLRFVKYFKYIFRAQ